MRQSGCTDAIRNRIEAAKTGSVFILSDFSDIADPEAVLTGPETRSSSPVRLLRGTDYQSVGMKGLYPCGEGAGWAGGIVSAAVDALRCCEAYLNTLL